MIDRAVVGAVGVTSDSFVATPLHPGLMEHIFYKASVGAVGVRRGCLVTLVVM